MVNNKIRKTLVITLVGLILLFNMPIESMAAEKQDNVTYGTWSRGYETVDPIPPFKGILVSPNGTETTLTSPINVVDSGTIEKAKKTVGNIGVSNFWDGSYYYEYAPGSYSQSSSSYDTYHYQVGQTQTYNGTANNQTLTYQQQNSATSQWSVSANISSTAELKTNWFQKLAGTFGITFTTQTTTAASTSITTSITVRPGYSGVIKAYLPGGYSAGWAKYNEYFYNSYTGTFISTGNYAQIYEAGWAPNAYGQQVNFKTATWYGI